MPSNVSHLMTAMVVQGAASLAMGGPALSGFTFFAGLVSMLINLDYSKREGIARTTWGHSTAGALLWSFSFFAICVLLSAFGFLVLDFAIHLSLAFAVSYGTHLALDSLTIEGIFIGRKRTNISRIGLAPRGENSALLNSYCCIISAIILMVYIGLTPL